MVKLLPVSAALAIPNWRNNVGRYDNIDVVAKSNRKFGTPAAGVDDRYDAVPH
jgi:hypothetical protein